MRTGTLLVCLWVLAGCDTTAVLTVDVRTDYLPGVEFDVVRTSLAGVDTVTHAVEPTRPYADGVRVAELLVERGTQELTLDLRDAEERTIAGRPLVVAVDGATAVTVVMTRDCYGLACPLAGDAPTARACLGGACVEPSCAVEVPDTCGTAECAADADCGDGSPSCVVPRCVSGACVLAPDDAGCGDDEVCHPERGCLPESVVGRCGLPDGDTLLQLSFDDDTAADDLGRNPGSVVGPGAFVDGPLGCGRAFAIPVDQDANVVVDDSVDWHIESGSVDFWFRHEAGLTQTAGLIGREQRARGAAHFTVALTQDDVVVVRLQGESSDAFACSPVAAPVEWHHVGVNFGPPGLELWMDGTRSSRDDTLSMRESEGTLLIACDDRRPLGFQPSETVPWVVGASGIRADDDADWADYLRGGAIDHLRVSAVRRDFSSP